MNEEPGFEFGDDGEFQEPTRKSKSDPYQPFWLRRVMWVVGFILFVLVTGVLVALIARYALPASAPVVLVVTATPGAETPLQADTSTQFVVVVTAIPAATLPPAVTLVPAATSTPIIIVVTATPQPTIALTETPLPAAPTAAQPEASTWRLLISLDEDGNLYTYTPENGLSSLSLQGHDVATAVDGKIAYWRPTQPFIYRDGKETAINSFGQIRKLAWSPDGKTLAFVGMGSDGEGRSGAGVFFVPITTTVANDIPSYLGLVPDIGGPPLFNPLTEKMVVVMRGSDQQSGFIEPDTSCGDCEGYLRGFMIASTPYHVAWATFDPDGSRIIFSEDSGDFYMLNTKTLATTPFLVDDVEKYRPTFSPDGELLAYLDDANQIYVLTLATNQVQTIQLDQPVDSFAWLNS